MLLTLTQAVEELVSRQPRGVAVGLRMGLEFLCRPGKQQPVEGGLSFVPLQPQRGLVFRGQLLDGFGLATAGQGFRSQRFRPAARRFTEIPAQKTEHRLWNIEMLWLRSEFVGTDARANQRQRK